MRASLPKIRFKQIAIGDWPYCSPTPEGISISIARFDVDWRQQLGDWVPPGAQRLLTVDTCDPAKYSRIHDWIIRAGQTLEVPPPVLQGAGDPRSPTIKVYQGRHRIAVLRDLGYTHVVVCVPDDILGHVRARYTP